MVTGVDVRVAGSFDSNLLVLGRVGFLDHLYHIERVCDYCFILFLCFALRNFSFGHWFQWHLWALGFLWFTNSKVGMNLQLFSSAFVLNAAWCPYHASLQNYVYHLGPSLWPIMGRDSSSATQHCPAPCLPKDTYLHLQSRCLPSRSICLRLAKFKISNLSHPTGMLHAWSIKFR